MFDSNIILFRFKNWLQVSSDPQMGENGFARAGTSSGWNLLRNEKILINSAHFFA
jgi:hypothetical protein